MAKRAERINEILSDDYIEFTSSGFEYHYKKGEVFQKNNDSTQLLWEIIDFNIKQLSDECVLKDYYLNICCKEYTNYIGCGILKKGHNENFSIEK